MATCMQAIMRSACGGSIRCFVTNADTFSFQSVIASADAVVPVPKRKRRDMVHCAERDMAISCFGFDQGCARPARLVTTVVKGRGLINGQDGSRLLHFLQ